MNDRKHTDGFEQLGQIARELHEALRKLGFEQRLTEVANEIPDARDRLAYVGKMTEEAAHKVLGTVERGLPLCEPVRAQGEALARRIRQESRGDISHDLCQNLLQECADYAQGSSGFAGKQGELLTEIMMAQSFQDLSGQVINRVIDIITRTERQILELLVDTAPDQVAADPAALEGPQVPDKALKQDDVDDLLASLGF
jgi:chemotaxis protein CheZ